MSVAKRERTVWAIHRCVPRVRPGRIVRRLLPRQWNVRRVLTIRLPVRTRHQRVSGARSVPSTRVAARSPLPPALRVLPVPTPPFRVPRLVCRVRVGQPTLTEAPMPPVIVISVVPTRLLQLDLATVPTVPPDFIALLAASCVRLVEVSCFLSSSLLSSSVVLSFCLLFSFSFLTLAACSPFFHSPFVCFFLCRAFCSSFRGLILFSAAPGSISYGTTSWALVRGVAASPLSILRPVDFGFPAATLFSISPSLPAGLVFDAATGNLSGTPTAVFSSISITVTLSNDVGPSSVDVSVSAGEWANNILALSLSFFHSSFPFPLCLSFCISHLALSFWYFAFASLECCCSSSSFSLTIRYVCAATCSASFVPSCANLFRNPCTGPALCGECVQPLTPQNSSDPSSKCVGECYKYAVWVTERRLLAWCA